MDEEHVGELTLTLDYVEVLFLYLTFWPMSFSFQGYI